MTWDNDYERDTQQGYDLGLAVGQEARDALASANTLQRSEIDTLRAELEALNVRHADADQLLLDCWNQLDGDAYLLADGSVHPGAVSTLHDLFAYLWPEKVVTS